MTDIKTIGTAIVVVDGGFVQVGEVTVAPGPFGAEVLISKNRNIRTWGTTRGLGELRTGPTKQTVVDEEGECIIPYARVIKIIPATGW